MAGPWSCYPHRRIFPVTAVRRWSAGLLGTGRVYALEDETDRVLKVGWCAQLAMADAGAESLSLSPSHVLTHGILTPTLFSTPSSSE